MAVQKSGQVRQKPTRLLRRISEMLIFFKIRLRNLEGFWQTWANFWTVGQDMLKMTVLSLSQHNFRKSQEF